MKPIDVPPIQDTIIKTPKARYLVIGVDAPPIGPTVIKVRQPSGRMRHLTVKDVGRPRFDAAVAHYITQTHREAPFIRPVGRIPDRTHPQRLDLHKSLTGEGEGDHT